LSGGLPLVETAGESCEGGTWPGLSRGECR